MSGWPVEDERSLKLPRKQLICYLTLSGNIAGIAMDKELNTRQDVLSGLVWKYKYPRNRFLLNKKCYTLYLFTTAKGFRLHSSNVELLL